MPPGKAVPRLRGGSGGHTGRWWRGGAALGGGDGGGGVGMKTHGIERGFEGGACPSLFWRGVGVGEEGESGFSTTATKGSDEEEGHTTIITEY